MGTGGGKLAIVAVYVTRTGRWASGGRAKLGNSAEC